jgi:hypothetical protein
VTGTGVLGYGNLYNPNQNKSSAVLVINQADTVLGGPQLASIIGEGFGLFFFFGTTGF